MVRRVGAWCNYLTGLELNARISQERYGGDEVYVLTIWPDRTRSLIRPRGLFFCGSVTEAGCAEALSGVLGGEEEWQNEHGRWSLRRWQIVSHGSSSEIATKCFVERFGTDIQCLVFFLERRAQLPLFLLP